MKCDIVFSPDDEAETGKGWYWSKWDKDCTPSETCFETREECESDAKKNNLHPVN